jgi:hypothetical protein
MSQRDFADFAQVSPRAIRELELGLQVSPATASKILATFAYAGIELTNDHDGARRPYFRSQATNG